MLYVWEFPSFKLLQAVVEREQPDIVIEERVSRYLSAPTTE